MRKSPVMIAEELKNSYETDEVVCEVSAVNGYLNFKINKTGFVQSVLEKILTEKDLYGASDIGDGKTVCLDYSSINIAKPFHIGHLSTTAIKRLVSTTWAITARSLVSLSPRISVGVSAKKLKRAAFARSMNCT